MAFARCARVARQLVVLMLLSVFAPTSSTDLLFRGHYYTLVTNRSTWIQAWMATNTMYHGNVKGELASVTSEAENTVLHQLARNNSCDEIWLGGHDQDSEAIWRWGSGTDEGVAFWQGGEVAGVYSNFAAGEPNNRSPGTALSQDCLLVRIDSQWDDRPCNSTLSCFVVEYPLPTTSTTATTTTTTTTTAATSTSTGTTTTSAGDALIHVDADQNLRLDPPAHGRVLVGGVNCAARVADLEATVTALLSKIASLEQAVAELQ
eukprot:m.323835 g.323835  ORF g.323835 m.323835 type:complete len:262 (+) comp19728_c5_seq4:156-941(+)